MQDQSKTRLDTPKPKQSSPKSSDVDQRVANSAFSTQPVETSQALKAGDNRQRLRSDTHDKTLSASLPCHIKVKDISDDGICIELPTHARVHLNDEIEMSDNGSPRIGIVRWVGSTDGERFSAGLEWK